MQVNREMADALTEEAELRVELEASVALKCRLEKNLQDPKETQTPFFSKINLLKQARLSEDHEKHLAVVMRHRKKVFDLRTQLNALQSRIDSLTLNSLQATHAPELYASQAACDFYDTVEQTIRTAQVPLQNCINALIQTRDTIDRDGSNQPWDSADARHLTHDSIRIGQELDKALQSINELRRTFEQKAFASGQPFSLQMLPSIDERHYAELLSDAFTQEPRCALTKLRHIQRECEALHEEIEATCTRIKDAQQAQAEQTNTIVRSAWQAAQTEFFSGAHRTAS